MSLNCLMDCQEKWKELFNFENQTKKLLKLKTNSFTELNEMIINRLNIVATPSLREASMTKDLIMLSN